MGKLNLLLGLIGLIFFSCAQEDETMHSAIKQVEETSDTVQLEYATGFKIIKKRIGTELLVYENGAIVDTYFCVKSPVKTSSDKTLVQVPINKLACMSTTYFPYLEKIDMLNVVTGVTNPKYVRNTEINKRLNNGTVISISGQNEIDMEKLALLQPEALMAYPFNNPDFDAAKEFGINVIYNTEYLEPHPLGQVEWLKFFGVLFDKENEANELYDRIKSQYYQAKGLISLDDKKRKVLAGSIYNDQWTAPGGNSIGAVIIGDANGQLVLNNDEKGSYSMPIETAVIESKEAEIWAMASYFEGIYSREELLKEDNRYSLFGVCNSGNIIHCNTAFSNYFEDALLEPHLILKDLIHLFYPEKLPDHKFKYFYRLQ